MRAIASLWFPPDAKRRVIVHFEGNRKHAMARMTSSKVFYYTEQHKNIPSGNSYDDYLNKTLN